MTIALKPSLLNLNVIDTTQKIGRNSALIGKSIYTSIKNATAEDVKEFTLKAGTNIAAGALTKAFVGAALAGSAPAVVTVGASAIAVGAVSTKLTHWRDCKKAIANNEEPPKFTWENYGLKGMFNTAMAGLGAFFSEHILGVFSPSTASAEPLLDVDPLVNTDMEFTTEQIVTSTSNPHTDIVLDVTEMQQVAPAPAELEIQPLDLVQAEPPEFFVPTDMPHHDVLPQIELDTVALQSVVPEIAHPIEPVAIDTFVTSVAPEIVAPTDIMHDLDLVLENLAPVEVETSAPEIFLADQSVMLEEQNLPEIVLQPLQVDDIQAPVEFIAPEAIVAPVVPDYNIANDVLQAVESPQILEPVELETVSETILPTPISVVEELQVFDLEPRAEFALEAHLDGNAQGTVDLGYFYFHGEQGVPQDYERAVELYREAAEQNNTFAVRDLPYVESEAEKALGFAVPEVVRQAENIVTTAPEVAVDDAVLETTTLSPIEELQAMDIGARAESALQSHLDGNAQGTADLGYFYFHGEQGLPQDYEKAVEFYREAAAEGNRFAIRDLAYIENEAEKALGYAVPETIEEPASTNSDVSELLSGVEELQAMDLGSRAEGALEAHLNGNAQGTADLGYFYFHGHQGMPQDLEKAVEFYRAAALEGNGYAIRDLAFVESEALKAGIELTDFDLPDHLYGQSAPAINNVSSSGGGTTHSGMRANCVGDLQAVNGSRPQLQFDCDVRNNTAYIYPGEHVSVRLPNGVSHTFNLDAGAGRQPVNDFLQNSVLPAAASSYGLN